MEKQKIDDWLAEKIKEERDALTKELIAGDFGSRILFFPDHFIPIPESLEPTNEWLEAINQKFIQDQIEHKERSLKALLLLYEKDINETPGKKARKKIEDYFLINTQEGCEEIGLLFTGLFYYDTCFWSIEIPFTFGTVKLQPDNFLDKKMPGSIKNTLLKNKEENSTLGFVLQNSINYAFGFDSFSKQMDFSGKNSKNFSVHLYRANENFMLAIYALLSRNVNSVTLQTMGLLGMSVELFLKSLLLAKGKPAKEVKGFKHELNNLSNAASIKSSLTTNLERTYGNFVNDRYSEKSCSKKDLWLGYQVALEIACIVLKELEKLTKNQAP